MSDTKLCPFCAEEIKAAAVKCKHCGSMLEDAVPRKKEILPITPDLPPQPASPVSPESNQEPKPAEEPAPAPQRKYIYSIILKKFEKDKVTLLARRLREVLQIPYSNMGDYVAEGKTLTSNLEENDAKQLMQTLSIPGVELDLLAEEAPPQLADEIKKKLDKAAAKTDSFIQDNLAEGEKVIYTAKLHKIVFFVPSVAVVLAVLLSLNQYGRDRAIWLIIVASIFAVEEFARFIMAQFVVTNRRIIKTGIVPGKSEEIYLDRIEKIKVDQAGLGESMGYGTIEIFGTGGSKELFRRVVNPLKFRKKVQEQIEATTRK